MLMVWLQTLQCVSATTLVIISSLLCLPVGYGEQSLAELALKVGGPRAPWDPLVLRGLLLRGRRAAAVAALRQLLARLQSRVRCCFLSECSWPFPTLGTYIQPGTGIFQILMSLHMPYSECLVLELFILPGK